MKSRIVSAFSMFILFIIALIVIIGLSWLFDNEQERKDVTSKFEFVKSFDVEGYYIDSKYEIRVYRDKDTDKYWISFSGKTYEDEESPMIKTELNLEDKVIAKEYSDCIIVNDKYIYFKSSNEVSEY